MEGVYFEDSQPDIYNEIAEFNDIHIPYSRVDSEAVSRVQFDAFGQTFVEDTLLATSGNGGDIVPDVVGQSAKHVEETGLAGATDNAIVGLTVEHEQQLMFRVKDFILKILTEKFEKPHLDYDLNKPPTIDASPTLNTATNGTKGLDLNCLPSVDCDEENNCDLVLTLRIGIPGSGYF